VSGISIIVHHLDIAPVVIPMHFGVANNEKHGDASLKTCV
jgi:hypothetical protein